MKYYLLIPILSLFTLFACKNKQYDCNDNRCELVPDAGECEAAIPKFYFDLAEGKCKEFTWGGCNGVVPFDSLEDCQICACTEK